MNAEAEYRYLVIDPDIGGTGIRDRYADAPGAWLSKEDLPLTPDLWERLMAWQTEYAEGIPYDRSNPTHRQRVLALDTKGLQLRMEVQQLLGDRHKITYFSEMNSRELVD